MATADAIRALLLQAPPGELNDCIANCRGIVGDQMLEQGIDSTLSEYNLQQLIVAEIPGAQHKAIICNAGRIRDQPGRFVDPRTAQSFVFDHLQSHATDVSPIAIDQGSEPLRKAVEDEATAYVAEHLSQGVAAVYAPLSRQRRAPGKDAEPASMLPDEAARSIEESSMEPKVDDVPEDETPAAEQTVSEALGTHLATDVSSDAPATVVDAQEVNKEEVTEPEESLPKRLTVAIVGNKFSPANYWTGRWRAVYEVDLERQVLSGTVDINVHYYEQGNVQLSTKKQVQQSMTLPAAEPAQMAHSIFKEISRAEKELQIAVNEAHVEMNDRTLKELRRTLPLTKSKIDWNRITSLRTAQQLKRAEA